jgi:hypothetical protein
MEDFMPNWKKQDRCFAWREYCKTRDKPQDIPANPHHVYKNEWKDMGDWLGTEVVSNKKRTCLPFEEAKAFVHNLGLGSQAEWFKYRKSGKKPDDIPTNPHRTYKKDFKGYGDWLGTTTVATSKREYRPFHDARQFVHKLKLRGKNYWVAYCKSRDKPAEIPSNPARAYKNEWNGWEDWQSVYYSNHQHLYMLGSA